ncbi:MAG: hypothetical protein AAF561_14890 [Planctomycetota bacterium]
MFELDLPLPRDDASLQAALDAAVRRVTKGLPPEGVVTVDGADRLAVELTHATVVVDESNPNLEPPILRSERTPGPTFASVTVQADPGQVELVGTGTLQARAHVTGKDVAFAFAETDRGTVAMVPAGGQLVADASVETSAFVQLVEIRTRDEAAKQNVQIKSLTADVSTPTPRTLVIRARVTGSKKVAFFNAEFAVDVVAEAVIETTADGLAARVTTLDVTGDGTVMSVILSLVKPRIDKIKAKPISLSRLMTALGLTGLHIDDVAVSAGERLGVRLAVSGSS